MLSRLLKDGPKRVAITANRGVIKLIRSYLPEECKRYSLRESDFVLTEGHSMKAEEFEIRYLGDQA